MPINCNPCDCSPLVIDNEIIVNDEKRLAEYIGQIIIGYYKHIQNIINSKVTPVPNFTNELLDEAISKLRKTPQLDVIKRDGWIFQIISWISLYKENQGKSFYCQQPHDAPAQHGIDGLAVLLDANKISKVIITEDKCTDNPRQLIQSEIWPEFKDYEEGEYNNKLVSRVSAMLSNLDNDQLLESIYKDAYRKEIRLYRVGINRDSRYKDSSGVKRLFKDYDNCVSGDTCERRRGSTLYSDNIRVWMESMSQLVIQYLESKKV